MIHLSYSKISTYEKCGYQGHLQYDVERRPPGVKAYIGRIAHRLQEGLLIGQLGDEITADLARALLQEAWDDQMPFLTADEATDESGVLSMAAQSTARLANAYGRWLGKHWVNLLATEKKLTVELEFDGVDVRLEGWLDVIERLPCGRTQILDRKNKPTAWNPVTGKTGWGRTLNKNAADVSLQLLIYAFLWWASHGQKEIPVTVFQQVVDRAAGTEVLEPLRTQSTLSDFGVLMERIKSVSKMISEDSYPAAPVDAWWCSANHCSWFRDCQFALNGKGVGHEWPALRVIEE